jgi:hypothetical protein
MKRPTAIDYPFSIDAQMVLAISVNVAEGLILSGSFKKP